MYRATTLYFLDNGIDWNESQAVTEALKNIKIHFESLNGKNTTFLNDKNIENEIRNMRVSNSVSPVAAISAVRKAMVAQQQMMGNMKGIVMDGRDIGTVVFPNAELKLFITADVDVRAERRTLELKSKGEPIDIEAVKKNLEERDFIDSNRKDSPLRQAKDAIVIDTTNLTFDEQLDMAYELVKKSLIKAQ